MKRISGLSLDKLMADAIELDPKSRIQLLSALPIHPDAKYTWRTRVPGRGVYMGEADEYTDEDGEKYIAMADPDTFIPEN
jgi:hypothetical protein